MTISWTSITVSVYGKVHGPHTAVARSGHTCAAAPGGWSSTCEPVPQLVAAARLLERGAERGEAFALGGRQELSVVCQEVEVGAGRVGEHAGAKPRGRGELHGVHAT